MPNPKKILIKNLPKFETDVYANLSLGDLVVFALSYLEDKEIEANTEEIISICFRLFPQKFGLKKYPRWPDSALVIRRLNDDREKKNIKGSPAEGFALTFKGKQLAKRIAKALGIVEKKKKTKPAPKQKPAALILTKKTLRKRARKPIQSKPVKKKAVKRVAKNTKTTVTAKLIIKKPIQNKPVKKKAVREAVKNTEKAVVVTKPIVKKPIQTKAVKKKAVKRALKDTKRAIVVAKPIVKKPIQTKAVKNVGHAFPKGDAVSVINSKKEKNGGLPIRPTKVKQNPKQLTMALATPASFKKKVGVKNQAEVKQEAAKPVKVEVAPALSKEEKIKAGKVMNLVEKSDAYKLYKKNGKQAKISEFDFRNMLFTTMESSSDTLSRNVLLFRKYANIHSRDDVVTFLNFCEEFFAKLLKKR